MVEVPQGCRVIWTAEGGVKCADEMTRVKSRGYVGIPLKEPYRLETRWHRGKDFSPLVCLQANQGIFYLR